MMEQELEKCGCKDGKEIDEYLACTICQADEEVEDVTVPDETIFEVDEPEEPKADERYKDFL